MCFLVPVFDLAGAVSPSGTVSSLMNSWYTVDEIDQKVFAIAEDQHWERVRSYLFRASEETCLSTLEPGWEMSSLPYAP